MGRGVMFRNFSNSSEDKLIKYVNNAGRKAKWNDANFISRISEAQKKIKKLHITYYLTDFQNYRSSIVAAHDDTVKKIKNIFKEERAHDAEYGKLCKKNLYQYEKSLYDNMKAVHKLLDTGAGGFDFCDSKVKKVEEIQADLEKNQSKWDDFKSTVYAVGSEIAKYKESILGTNPQNVILAGDPVNMATGNYVYDKEDLKISGDIPLVFHRYYNSQDNFVGCLGRGFRHNFDIRLYVKGQEAFITMPNGSRENFLKNEEGKFFSTTFSDIILQYKEDSTKYEANLSTGITYVFDEAGYIIRSEDQNHKGITYFYDENGMLERVENDYRDVIFFEYEGNRLHSVRTSSDCTLEMLYKGEQLDTVIMPNGTRYYYRYSENNKIVEIKNARDIITVHNEYDQEGRIIKQSFVDGSVMYYEYEEDELIFTDRNGSKICYVHDELFRNTDVIYDDGTSEHFEYDERNQKILSKDRNGNVTRYRYDNRGNLIQIINAMGQRSAAEYDENDNLLVFKENRVDIIRNCYDKNGNIITTTDAEGNTSRFEYNEGGNLISVEDAEGNVRKLSYDEKGNIVEIINPDGFRYQYVYDEKNRVIKTIDANGNETNYGYDIDDQIIEVTNAVGDRAYYAYNASGKVTSMVDFDGYKISVDYNDLNKEKCVIDKEGNQTSFEYDAMWNIEKMIRPDGSSICYKYDLNNRLERLTMPNGSVTNYQYDGNGNLLYETDALGKTVSYTYDALGRRTSITDQEGNSIKLSYDAEGNLMTILDPLGNVTSYKYDKIGNCLEETNVLGETVHYQYDKVGNVIMVSYPSGVSEKRRYLNGHLSKVERNNGESVEVYYDGNGNVISEKNGLGEQIRYVYDQLNRLVKVIWNSGAEREIEYDKVGNVTSVIDENGGITRYQYSPNGNLSCVIDANGNRAEYSYDVLGNLVEAKQIAENDIQTTLYEWDSNSQVTKVTDPLGFSETYEYDALGRIISKIDKEKNQTVYQYNSVGDITRILYGDGKEVEFSYDALRHLREMKDWNGLTQIENDPLGRAISVVDVNGQKVQYEWGYEGQKKKMIYPDGKEAVYHYTEQGMLKELITPNGKISYDYDEIGRVGGKTYSNGAKTTYEYNKVGYIENIVHKGKDFEETYHYEYDKAGNKILALKHRPFVEADSGTFQYRYDALNQLIEVSKDGQLLREYKYDAFGNRIKKVSHDETISEIRYTYNKNNQLVQEEEGSILKKYSYDRRGNIQTVMAGQDLIQRFCFDARGVLKEIEDNTNGLGRKASFEYNGLGKRVMQVVTGSQNPEEQIMYTLDLTRQYHNLLAETDLVNQESHSSTYYYDFNVVEMEKDTQKAYFMQDELGSVLNVLSEDGLVMENYAYDEFGMEYGNVIDARNRFQNFGYTGYQKEVVGNLYFAQARRYDASQGRFISEDIVRGFVENPTSLNHYVYCRNRVFCYVDPDGNICHILAGAIVGAIVGGGWEVVSQLTDDKDGFDGGSFVGAIVGGAVTGGITAAWPAAATPGVAATISTVAGGTVERLVKGLIHHDSAHAIILDVGVGAVTDVAFSGFGDMIAKTPAVKGFTDCFNMTNMGKKVSKANRYYNSVITRAQNHHTKVHMGTIINGVVSKGGKKITKEVSKYIFNMTYTGGIDIKKDIKSRTKDFIEENIHIQQYSKVTYVCVA